MFGSPTAGHARRPASQTVNPLNVCYRREADSADWAEEPEDSGLLSGAEPLDAIVSLLAVVDEISRRLGCGPTSYR
jgi:hypothetical protein